MQQLCCKVRRYFRGKMTEVRVWTVIWIVKVLADMTDEDLLFSQDIPPMENPSQQTKSISCEDATWPTWAVLQSEEPQWKTLITVSWSRWSPLLLRKQNNRKNTKCPTQSVENTAIEKQSQCRFSCWLIKRECDSFPKGQRNGKNAHSVFSTPPPHRTDHSSQAS